MSEKIKWTKNTRRLEILASQTRIVEKYNKIDATGLGMEDLQCLLH
jgi:hypothetical protein